MAEANNNATTPATKPDIEDSLDSAFHMSSIASVLAETMMSTSKHSEDGSGYSHYLIPDTEIDRMLFSLYEAHAHLSWLASRNAVVKEAAE
jgi:hypothetical protein